MLRPFVDTSASEAAPSSRPRPGYPAAPAPPPAEGPKVSKYGLFELVFGVILPLATIVIELATRLCASVFFDPLPSPLHVLLALLAPVSSLAIWMSARLPVRVLVWLNSFALVIAAAYAIPFVPLVPLGILASAMLIGLLPLSPFFSLWVAIRQRRALARQYNVPPLWRTIPVAMLVLAMASLPHAVTRGSLFWTLDSPGDRPRAVWLIRHFGSESALLDAARSRGRSVLELALPAIPESHARDIFYRVTGRDANLEPHADQAWTRFFDPHVGTSTVGAVLPNLRLASSQIDGTADPEAALRYLEWTMLFRNADPSQREARATVQLPQGAVVSRVTLWIDGEPRDAAFGGRAATTRAYQAVVAARRDPLLVTTAGPGRVLVQCFPIPGNGEMKIRIGITAPLDSGGAFPLPYFQDHNFTAPGSHNVWIEAPRQQLRQQVPHADLDKPLAGWTPVTAAGLAWTPDPHAPGFVIRQRMVEQPRRRFGKLIYVVDGSASMRPYADALSRQLRGDVILGSDEVRVTRRLSRGDFAGGGDNVAALLAAQDQAATENDAAIVWIHGPQPVALTDAEGLRQFWTRRPGHAPLYSLQMVRGPNAILKELDNVAEVRSLAADPENVLAAFVNPKPELVAVRERVTGVASRGHRTSAHLARLWAFEESVKTGDAALAARYQLVTPLTGAVVLESKQQYKAAGLAAAAPGTVPTVPEPETWALMIAGLAVIGYKVRRSRQCA